MIRRASKRPRVIAGGQPVFDNDDSSNHSGLAVADFDENSLSLQNEASTNSSDQQHFPQNQFVPDRTRTPQSRPTNNQLNACLDHLLTILSRKDKEGFFQYPVTDQLAPGYSQMITNPMDFSTMRKKVNNDEYLNILQFRIDFDLICENAMKYNRPETIYWQAAKRLSQSAGKIFSKEKLLSFRRHLECFNNLTEREFGFRLDYSSEIVDEQTLNGTESMEICSNVQENSIRNKVPVRLAKYYEKLPNLVGEEEDEDESTGEETLLQAQQIGPYGREKFSLRRPNSNFSFSKQRANGTTELNFLNQTESSNNQGQVRLISIGELSNFSCQGLGSNFVQQNSNCFVNEIEKRKRLLPRFFLDYGSFSSHAPQFDTSFCSTSKDELDLLLHTYGSEFATQNFLTTFDELKNSGDIALTQLDEIFSSNKKRSQTTSINGHVQNQNEKQKLDSKLDETSKLLFELRQTQQDRFSQVTNKNFQQITTNEIEIAEKIFTNFTEISKTDFATPERFVEPETIRRTLGIVSNGETSNFSNSIETL